MKYFTIILVFFAYSVRSDSYVIPIPDGMIAFWSFHPKTELEVKAFAAAKVYLKDHDENLNKYYLAENDLDVNSGLYRFYIKHSSTYRKNKMRLMSHLKMALFTTMLRRIRLLNLSANNNLTSAGSGFAVLSAAEKVSR